MNGDWGVALSVLPCLFRRQARDHSHSLSNSEAQVYDILPVPEGDARPSTVCMVFSCRCCNMKMKGRKAFQQITNLADVKVFLMSSHDPVTSSHSHAAYLIVSIYTCSLIWRVPPLCRWRRKAQSGTCQARELLVISLLGNDSEPSHTWGGDSSVVRAPNS